MDQPLASSALPPPDPEAFGIVAEPALRRQRSWAEPRFRWRSNTLFVAPG